MPSLSLRIKCRLAVLMLLVLGLGACTHHQQTVVPIPLAPTAKADRASRSALRIPVRQILIDAPKAGDVLVGFAVNGQSMYGPTQMVVATNVYHAGSDVAPLLLSSLSSSFAIDQTSPYLAQIELKPEYWLGRTGFWGVTGTTTNRLKLSLKLLENGKTVLGKSYEALAEDEFSLFSSDFPPPEMVTDLLQKTLAETARKLSTDPALGKFRATGQKASLSAERLRSR